MALAHLGVGVFIVGVTASSTYSLEKDIRVAPGDSYELAGYRFEFDGVSTATGPNYIAQRGAFRVYRGDDLVTELHPEKRAYPIQEQPMTEAAIDAGLTRDLYVALGEPLTDGAWSVRLYFKPLQRWIWLGPALMALGGLLAASDRRYRIQSRARESARDSSSPTPAAALKSSVG